MNYQQHIKIGATRENVFLALTQQLEKWWGEIDLPLNKLGDVFTVYFGKAFWKFRVTEYKTNESINWLCIGGEPDWNKEWIGTSLYWQIKLVDNEVELKFTHDGLVPEFHCYDVCAPTWDKYITVSLKNFLDKGEGMPHQNV